MKNDLKNFCIIHVNSTQNNTILTANDLNDTVITTKSLGLVTKKRGKRSVPNGALLTGESLGSFLMDKGFSNAQIRIKGFGSGRENAIQGLVSSGLKVVEILDMTQIPHNGCRPKKRRRI